MNDPLARLEPQPIVVYQKAQLVMQINLEAFSTST
jgi:hypothetical protein